MQIWTPEPRARDDGEFAVRLNPGSPLRDPFAIIDLSEDGRTALTVSPADCDRLIRAAQAAKQLLAGGEGK